MLYMAVITCSHESETKISHAKTSIPWAAMDSEASVLKLGFLVTFLGHPATCQRFPRAKDPTMWGPQDG